MTRHLLTCPQCGYSLQGLPADYRCPECGYGFQEQARAALAADYLAQCLPAYRRANLLALIALVALSPAFAFIGGGFALLTPLAALLAIGLSLRVRGPLATIFLLMAAGGASVLFWMTVPGAVGTAQLILLLDALRRATTSAGPLPFRAALLLDYERAELTTLRRQAWLAIAAALLTAAAVLFLIL